MKFQSSTIHGATCILLLDPRLSSHSQGEEILVILDMDGHIQLIRYSRINFLSPQLSRSFTTDKYILDLSFDAWEMQVKLFKFIERNLKMF